jgi:protein-S-isoprenylcysteine O-methyltransferase Ste14
MSDDMTDSGISAKLIPDVKRGIVRELTRPLIHLCLLLTAAGRWDWVNAWIFFATLYAILIVYVSVLYRKSPELLAVRSRIQPKTRTFDKIFLLVYLFSALGGLVFMGLDGGRYHWSDLPRWTLPVGLAAYMVSFAFILWAMSVNRHFEGTVRIQEERDHKVCTAGPYQWVRHPGYLGMLIGMFCLPLILDTGYGLIISAWLSVLLLVRTAMEDAMLRRDLNGYADYAQQVRFRVLPGIW